ncbi:PREDICTED: uncharacterized protein LOC105316296 [Amphimedon queenslandica]|nr:PREDICTED: uncharacterized protein LOC105316296 [Amphimedon queenslandica]|eukprot:XP_011409426.1 PREDICTED: uncharacterized protein LOC105316296 [Amphimedon queenslandica]
MTGEHFEEWFRDSLLPNVPPNSLIVMNNASYHSRIEEEIPKKSWTKCKMIVWLVYYGKEFFDDDCTKSQLLAFVQDAAKRMGLTTTKYIVDEMALKAGHEAQVKGHIKANTSKLTLDEVKSLAEAGFEVVNKERWADLVKHVRDKVEDRYWQNDNLNIDECFRVPDFVIHVHGESDDALSETDAASGPDSLDDCVAAIDSDEDI